MYYPFTSTNVKTWTIIVGLIHKFQVVQRTVERAMLRVSFLGKIGIEDIRNKTKMTDVGLTISKLMAKCSSCLSENR